MFDVNTPQTMEALKKWWAEFRHSAPLADEDAEDFCCVVVGNKMDLVPRNGSGNGHRPVTEAGALDFLRELVPHTSRPPSPIHNPQPNGHGVSIVLEHSREDDHEEDPLASPQLTAHQLSQPKVRSNSIAIIPNPNLPSSHFHSPKHRLSKSRSRSPSHFYGGTMTTSHTTLTVYHTPSSSLFDVYQSARTSPESWSTSTSSSPSTSTSTSTSPRRRTITSSSIGSDSTGSAVTITPSLFARGNSTTTDTSITPDDHDPFSHAAFPPPLERGPKLFFTSAKTGEGVSVVFEYIAWRVVRRWEYEENLEARQVHIRQAGASETIRLDGQRDRSRWTGSACCGS